MNYNIYFLRFLLAAIAFASSYKANGQMIYTSNNGSSIFYLKSDGSLWSWGNNENKVVANSPSNIVATANERVEGTTWKTVAAGIRHVLAIKPNGTLWAWGQNTGGQAGDGTVTDIDEPKQIGSDTDWKMVSAGQYGNSAGIKNDGSLYMWGAGSSYGLGFGNTSNVTVPTRLGTDTWKYVSCGPYIALAIKSDGTLWGWGYNTEGKLDGSSTTIVRNPIQIGNFNDWVMVSAGGLSHSAGIRANGELYTWGTNTNGQLGTGLSGMNTMAKVGSDQNWKSVSVAGRHTIALKTDGTMWAWGQSDYGKLGLGTPLSDVAAPQQVGTDKDWTMALAGEHHSVALKSDGTVWVSGRNDRGQHGNRTYNSTAYVATFTEVTNVLPLTLFDFSASVKPNFVALSWKTSQESNTADFDIERKTDNSDWAKVATIKAAGTSTCVKNYSYSDYDVNPATYYYRLKMNDLDGSFTYSEVKTGSFGKDRALVSIYPNPAIDKITVNGNVSAYAIHNIEGKKVQEGKPESGNQIVLNGLASGVYLITLETPEGISRIKLQKN